jgi:hypothetical protein
MRQTSLRVPQCTGAYPAHALAAAVLSTASVPVQSPAINDGLLFELLVPQLPSPPPKAAAPDLPPPAVRPWPAVITGGQYDELLARCVGSPAPPRA